MKSTNPQIQEASYTLDKINTKKTKARHIIKLVKLVKIKDKDKTLKSEVKVKH